MARPSSEARAVAAHMLERVQRTEEGARGQYTDEEIERGIPVHNVDTLTLTILCNAVINA